MTSEQSEKILSVLAQKLPLLGEETLPCAYLQWLTDTLASAQNADFQEKFQPQIDAAQAAPHPTPFLSILLRTQG